MAKIAKIDNEALNKLYTRELAKVGLKVAANDDKQAPDAFKDHEEFIKTVESVLSDDKNVKGSDNPNDPDFD